MLLEIPTDEISRESLYLVIQPATNLQGASVSNNTCKD